MKYIIESINKINKNDIDIFYNRLPMHKKIKLSKYKSNKSKIQSILGDILLEKLLLNLNINYCNLSFQYNNYGKPFIKNKKIYFNISHSHEYVITAVSDKEIGIDIEKIRKTNLNTINLFATKSEKEYIFSSKKNIYKRLFEIYTLKEAYIKMNGTNLNDLLKVEFKISNNKVECKNESITAGFIQDINGYIISYCEKN